MPVLIIDKDKFVFNEEHLYQIVCKLETIINNMQTKPLEELFQPFNTIIENMLCLQKGLVDSIDIQNQVELEKLQQKFGV